MVDLISGILLLACAALLVLIVASNDQPDVHPAQLRQQSDVSRTRNKGETAIYRSRMSPNSTALHASPTRDLKSLVDVFKSAFRGHAKNDFVGELVGGSYVWSTYADIETKVKHMEKVLVHQLRLSAGSTVALMLGKHKEHVVLDLACVFRSIVTLPLDSNLPSAVLQPIFSITSPTVIVVDKLEAVNHALDAARSNAQSSIKFVVYVDKEARTLEAVAIERAAKEGVTLLTYRDLETATCDDVAAAELPKPKDILTVHVTIDANRPSPPHAVSLTHANLLAQIAALSAIGYLDTQITSKDTVLSVLPFSQASSRSFFYTSAYKGARVALTSVASPLAAVLQNVQPTILHTNANKLQPMLAQLTNLNLENFGPLEIATEMRLKMISESGRIVRNGFWDKLLFNTMRNKYGIENVKCVFLEGGMSPNLVNYTRLLFASQVLEIVSLPETSGVCFMTLQGDYQYPFGSHFGTPVSCNEMKLIDHDDGKGNVFRVTDSPNPRGMLLLRGGNIFHGYVNDPHKTAGVVDVDGWYHTGIIAEILPNGTTRPVHIETE
ncbi:hypothetical protein BJ742DRAFT_806723 [Cladochytrium replicatum]|nr:hypothetical protein BJ742DRAFT_806723 [Cladochytrium replicatum]